MIHLVNTLRFELKCPDERMAFNTRQNFAQTLQLQIAEVLDDVCSEYVSENESIRIDKLELDLGLFSPRSFDVDFKNVLQSKFQHEFKKILSGISPTARLVSRRLSNEEMFFYFLIHGSLPWWADKATVNMDEICQEICANQPDMAREFLYQNKSKENVWKRVLWQLSDKSKTLIIDLLAELKSAQDLFTTWMSSIISKMSQRQIQIPHGASAQDLQKRYSDENHWKKIIRDALIMNAVPIISTEFELNVLKEIFKGHLIEDFSRNKSVADLAREEFEKIASDGNADHASMAETLMMNDEARHKNLAFKSSDIKPHPEEKYAVKNAGIILLAPFFKPFFEELELLVDGNWKSHDAAFKGVHLLRFLSQGQLKSPEYELVFEKILCGISVDTPVPLDIDLDQREIDEAESLLEAVIKHWKILKNTSINGLRETFLKRDGLVTRKENGWLLQVERKTLDVLLEKMPWGYSTISLSWNNYLVFVEW